MQYALLGHTGLVVSRLAFGAMTFTAGNRDIGAIYRVGAQAAGELLSRALEAGVNFCDTADAHAGGESESLLGAALKPYRDRVVIATRTGRGTRCDSDDAPLRPRAHGVESARLRIPERQVHARESLRSRQLRRSIRTGSMRISPISL